MNVAPLVLRTQVIDQRINSPVYVKVLISEPMNFPLSVSSSKGEMGNSLLGLTLSEKFMGSL